MTINPPCLPDLLNALIAEGLSFALCKPMHETGLCLLLAESDAKASDPDAERFILAPFDPKGQVLHFSAAKSFSGDAQALASSLEAAMPKLQQTAALEQKFTAKSSAQLTASCRELNLKARCCYEEAFAVFKRALDEERFAKLVLSHPYYCPLTRDPAESFLNIAACYPQAFCYLAHFKDAGLFMGASPELLAEIQGRTLRTVSLAGTLPHCSDGGYHWSAKDLQEQAIVTDYIKEVLQPYAKSLELEGPLSAEAGPVAHLKTFITAQLHDDADPLAAVTSLHPTPAVCGAPKLEALQFILDHEGYDRGYYAGFIGTVSQKELKLYVNLRSLSIEGQIARLCAGGGLLKASKLESEWQETLSKLKTLEDLI